MGVSSTRAAGFLCMGSAVAALWCGSHQGEAEAGGGQQRVCSHLGSGTSPSGPAEATPSESIGFSGEKGCVHSLLPTTSLAPPAAAAEKHTHRLSTL